MLGMASTAICKFLRHLKETHLILAQLKIYLFFVNGEQVGGWVASNFFFDAVKKLSFSLAANMGGPPERRRIIFELFCIDRNKDASAKLRSLVSDFLDKFQFQTPLTKLLFGQFSITKQSGSVCLIFYLTLFKTR